jgi:hypothetical protein
MDMGAGKNKKVALLRKVDNVVWNHFKIKKLVLCEMLINSSSGGFYCTYKVASALKANCPLEPTVHFLQHKVSGLQIKPLSLRLLPLHFKNKIPKMFTG